MWKLGAGFSKCNLTEVSNAFMKQRNKGRVFYGSDICENPFIFKYKNVIIQQKWYWNSEERTFHNNVFKI